jgi:4-oxalocrotonate tautomerase
MPMITIAYATAREWAGLKRDIATAVSALSAQHLRKDPKVTSVLVQAAPAADWFVGGPSLADASLASFWLDIRIVDGTNTREQKADFIAAVYGRMGELLGPLHNESYVHVHDVRGDAYGYGGITQNERYMAGKFGPRTAKAD